MNQNLTVPGCHGDSSIAPSQKRGDYSCLLGEQLDLETIVNEIIRFLKVGNFYEIYNSQSNEMNISL